MDAMPVNVVEHLADISLGRWWRPKPELKERRDWTEIHHVTQTRVQTNDRVASVTAEYVKEQLSADTFSYKVNKVHIFEHTVIKTSINTPWGSEFLCVLLSS